MTQQQDSPRTSVRYIPDDWLYPIDPSELFPSGAPLEVDLGCGKGRFLLSRATAYPQINYLGIDRMLKRIRKIDRKASRRGLDNIRLLRMEAYYAVLHLVPRRSVSTYYIFFPDPWPKKRHHKNRLFDPSFMDALVQTLCDRGKVHIATDHAAYFEEIETLLEADQRFERTEPFIPTPDEKTDFELLFEDRFKTNRISVQLREEAHGLGNCAS